MGIDEVALAVYTILICWGVISRLNGVDFTGRSVQIKGVPSLCVALGH